MSALTLRSGAAGGATGAFVVAALQALGNQHPGLHLAPVGAPTVQCIHQAPCQCDANTDFGIPLTNDIQTYTVNTPPE